MRTLVVLLSLWCGMGVLHAEDFSKDAVWITGDVITRSNVLFFRTDKPVQGNTTGDLVMLRRELSLVVKAAEKHRWRRWLFGGILWVHRALAMGHGRLLAD